MEHRWDKRSDVFINVLLYHHNRPVARARARDAGSAGMFVEANSVFYAINTVLEVEFVAEPTPLSKRLSSYRLPVMVVHNSKAGMGLMFRKSASEALQAWQQVIQQSSVCNYKKSVSV